MKLIEPCCAERHVRELRDALKDGGSREIEGYGDLSLSELLPAILTRYYETEVLIAAPSVPDQAAETIATWMRRSIARMDGKGRLNYIAHLTIVADLSEEQSPMASEWLKENPFPGRLELVDGAQADTAILLPDFAITGPVNMRYGHHFTATATTVREQVEGLWKRYSAPAEAKPSSSDGGADGETGKPEEPAAEADEAVPADDVATEGANGAEEGTQKPAAEPDGTAKDAGVETPRKEKKRVPFRR